jgi:hypothetical protein
VVAGLLVLVLSGVLPPSAAHGATSSSSISLESETPWVTSTAGMTISVGVQSPIARSDLAIQITPYEPLVDRSGFEATTLPNGVSNLTPWPTQPVLLPLTTKELMHNNVATVELRVAPPAVPGRALAAPSNGAVLDVPCSGECAGVYPLQVSLVDTQTYTPLDSASHFVTYLVIAPTSVPNPLRFSFVLPLGVSPSFSASGSPDVSTVDEDELETIESELASHSGADVSLALYPQLAEALAGEAAAPAGRGRRLAERNAARTALSALRALPGLTNVEIDQSTYASADLSALDGSGLDSEVGDQIAMGRSGLSSFGVDTAGRPFVSATPLGPGALQLLTENGVNQVVVPSSSVSAVPSSWVYPVWAPFRVKDSPAVVDASDYYLEQHLLGGGDAVLRADQLLADLALLYFVEPGVTAPRGLTLLAPIGWHPGSQFLATLLSGLSTSSIVRSVTLSQFFAQVRPGADEIPSGAAASPLLFRSVTAGSITAPERVPVRWLASSRSEIAALASMLPHGSNLIGDLDRLVLVGESVGVRRSVRHSYFQAPAHQMRIESAALSLPSRRTITITSLSAKVPISVASKARTPLKVTLRLSECPPQATSCDNTDISFLRHSIPLTLTPGNRTIEVRVAARSSGDFPIYLELATPSGVSVVTTVLIIRSTAISGVAVVLTVVAGVFLIAWWGRSVLKRRRGRHARPPAPDSASALS